MTKKTSKAIVLIGMPGVGKSTVGVLLAKSLGLGFIDTDRTIEKYVNSGLQKYINQNGYQSLRTAEEQVLLKEDVSAKVVATGGSAVYSDAGMIHLKSQGMVIFLDLPQDQLERRITNFTTRGIARRPNQSFSSLFNERRELYLRYADIQVDCNTLDINALLNRLVAISKPYINGHID
jgi:shikimate kinase